MQPWVLQDLEVSGPWGTAVANATSLRGGFAPQYNALALVLYDCPVSHLWLRNQAVTVTLVANGLRNCLFVGIVRAAKRLVGGADENALYVEVDGAECTADRDYCGSVRAADALAWFGAFNEEGRPNSHPTLDEYDRAPDAVFWSGASAIRRVRDKWMKRSTWTLTDAEIGAVAALDQEIKPLDPRGMRPLAVIAEILKRCGCRLAFRYATGVPVPVIFDQNGAGAFEVIWKPQTYPPADPNDPLYNEVYEIGCGYDARGTFAVLDTRSGGRVVETSYSTTGATPLLAGAASSDKKFRWEYRVRPENYALLVNGLGTALAATARPWPIRPDLVTRAPATAGVAYHSAAEVTADPEIGKPVACSESLAILIGTTWKRIVGGAKLDLRSETGALIRLQSVIVIANLSPGSKAGYTVPTGAAPDVRITCATQIPDTAVLTRSTYAAAPAAYAEAVDGLLNLEGIEPGYRLNSILPDPTAANPNTWETHAAAAIETYRSVTAVLTAASAGPYAQRGRDASLVDVMLPFWPGEIPLGALLTFTPVPLNAGITGREIIREYHWDLGEVEVRLRASDSFDLADSSESADMRDIMKRLRRVERGRLNQQVT